MLTAGLGKFSYIFERLCREKIGKLTVPVGEESLPAQAGYTAHIFFKHNLKRVGNSKVLELPRIGLVYVVRRE